MTQLDITNLSLPELKALGFDEMNKIEVAKQNLQILQQEINKRYEEDKKIAKPEESKPNGNK